MNEIFKDVAGYEGLYQVSNMGSVRSMPRNTTNGKILKPGKDKDRLKVYLCRDGERKSFWVHRLVANAFLSNPLNLPVINHKDENPSNNVVSNLEFCSVRYNNCYGTALKRKAAKLVNGPCSKPVLQYDKDGNFLKRWPSIMEIKRQLGFHKGAICQCCNGERKSANGFVWKYED